MGFVELRSPHWEIVASEVALCELAIVCERAAYLAALSANCVADSTCSLVDLLLADLHGLRPLANESETAELLTL